MKDHLMNNGMGKENQMAFSEAERMEFNPFILQYLEGEAICGSE